MRLMDVQGLRHRIAGVDAVVDEVVRRKVMLRAKPSAPERRGPAGVVESPKGNCARLNSRPMGCSSFDRGVGVL